MVNSGTEAAMSAIRLARAATGREPDPQVRRRLPRPRRRAPGRGRLGDGDRRGPRQPRVCTEAQAASTVVVPWNDPDALERGDRRAQLRRDPRRADPGEHGRCSPRGRLPRVPPRGRRLERRPAGPRRGDQRLPRRRAAAPRSCSGSSADLTIMGKVLGGGLPAAAYGGPARADGAGRAGGRRLPGGHALRKPARGRRRAGDPRRSSIAAAYGRLAETTEELAAGLRRGRRRARRCRSPPSPACSPSSSAPSP